MIYIVGPCVIEEATIFECAKRVSQLKVNGGDLYFKSSWCKANRTSITSYRGVGNTIKQRLHNGIEIFKDIKAEYGLKILTDIHESWQADSIAEVADVLQIPAALSRQTDLIIAAGVAGQIVNIKKSQSSSPEAMEHAVEKARLGGASEVWITERGTTHGYGSLIVDMRSLVIMSQFAPVVFDMTHSCQKPGGSVTGGAREYALPLALAATAVGVHGVFLEAHPSPSLALSDAGSQIPLDAVQGYIDQIERLDRFLSVEEGL